MGDVGFRPILGVNKLSHSNINTMASWAMDPVAEPVTSSDERNIAIWKGGFNDRGEAPVLVVSTERGMSISHATALWFCGLALMENVTSSPSELEALADAATYQAEYPNEAFDVLKALLTGRRLTDAK